MTPNTASGLALIAALAWGAGSIAQKTVLDHLDAYSATGLTSLIGVLVLLPLGARERRRALPPASGSGWLLVAVSLLFTLACTLMQFSFGLTTVTNAGFLVNITTVLTPLLAWICLSQRPPVAIWPSGLAAFLGVFLMAGAEWTGFSPGDVLALMSALAFAVWTLTVGLYVLRYRRPVMMTITQLSVCGVICTSIGTGLNGLPAATDLIAALPEILFIGLVAKGIAYVLVAIAAQHLSAARVSILLSADAVFGALFAAWLLGETLGLLGGIGSLCIVLGVVIAAQIPAAAQVGRFWTRKGQP